MLKDIDGYVSKDNLYRLISKMKPFLDAETCSNIVEAIADMPKSNVSEVPKEIFEDLKLAKQYLSELINIVDSFGLDDIYSCGQHDYACKNCKHFSEHLNHNLCEDEEFFVWKHKQDAIDLINKVEK